MGNDHLSLESILTLANAKYSEFQTLWTIFISVSTGLLTLFYYVLHKQIGEEKHIVGAIILSAFIIYSYANYKSMRKLREDRIQLKRISKQFCTNDSEEPVDRLINNK